MCQIMCQKVKLFSLILCMDDHKGLGWLLEAAWAPRCCIIALPSAWSSFLEPPLSHCSS